MRYLVFIIKVLWAIIVKREELKQFLNYVEQIVNQMFVFSTTSMEALRDGNVTREEAIKCYDEFKRIVVAMRTAYANFKGLLT